MPIEMIVMITALLTLAYALVGLRAMLLIDAAFGQRFLPRTELGTWAGLALWPVAFVLAWLRFRAHANRRVLS